MYLNFTVDLIFELCPLTYILDLAAQQQLVLMEVRKQKSKEKYSDAIKEMKLRQWQAMGAGSYDTVHEERMPVARIAVLQLFDIDCTQVFHFLLNTGMEKILSFTAEVTTNPGTCSLGDHHSGGKPNRFLPCG